MPRRGENIYKRKDGRWEGRVKGPQESCNRGKYKSVYGKTYKEVKSKMDEYKKDMSIRKNSHMYIVKEAAGIWLEEGKKNWKPTTYRTYCQITDKYIIPFLGCMDITAVDAKTLDKFHSQLACKSDIPLSNNYCFYICSLVLRILRYSRKKYDITLPLPELSFCKNKMQKINPPGERVLATLERYLVEHAEDETCLGISIALYTGIRIGELCALTWKDVDLEDKIIYIRRNVQRAKEEERGTGRTKIIIQSPKTPDSVRFIPIPPVLCKLLQGKEKEGFLISGVKHDWVDPRTLQYRFRRILDQCGIEYFNFHMLRHVFATRCVAMGFDIKSLSEILGHSSIQTTMSLYVHPTVQHKRQLMERFLSYADPA